MPVEDVSKFEILLRNRLRDLDTRLSGVEAELDKPAAADSEERATEREGDEVLESLGNAGLLESRMIQAALGRIADGTFEAPDQVRGIGSARAGLTPAEFADQLKPTRNFA